MRIDTCPHCGIQVRHEAMGEHGAEPGKGDLTVCNTCGEISMFTEDSLEIITDDELDILSSVGDTNKELVDEMRNYSETLKRYNKLLTKISKN